MVFAAHPDDEIIGVGGTIAKLSKKHDVYVVVFSYGSGEKGKIWSWPPTIEREKLKEARIKESKRAAKIVGAKNVFFLGIEEDIHKHFNEFHREALKRLIAKYKPIAVFYHSKFDGHKEHRFVHKVVSEILDEMGYKGKRYTYEINTFSLFAGRKYVVDISKFFAKKMKALKEFKTQLPSIVGLKPVILMRTSILGKVFGKKYVEVFNIE